MPESIIRLMAVRESDPQTVRFAAVFAAPASDAAALCAQAELRTGDGTVYDLGLFCAPTSTTWRETRSVELVTHRFGNAGPHAAELRWGEVAVQATMVRAEPVRAVKRGPLLSLFAIAPVRDQPFRRLVKFRVDGLSADQQVRLDGGAGEVHVIPADGDCAAGELELSYAKPGAYTVALDVLDEEGFWLTTVAQSPLELAEPELAHVEPAKGSKEALLPAPDETRVVAEPWLPWRNFKPVRSGVRTYSRPGGGGISRVVSPWVWLTARSETAAGGQRWLQTAIGDWISADEVTFFEPSALRGIILAETQPPPQPSPVPVPSPGDRHAVITAATLNVRARPGMGGSNPPVATLRAGTEVSVLEEVRVDGVSWYRIGQARWIHSAYARLLDQTDPAPQPPAGRKGIVTAATLNVRARPGVFVGNPPVAVLRSGATVTIHEEHRVSEELWYRISDSRWVVAQWVRLVDQPARSVETALDAARARLPFGWVVPDQLAVFGRPGAAADNLPVGELKHYDVVHALEERTVGGKAWIRIGDNQWVDGGSVGVARFRPRPGSIGANERWVGVCLSEQTLVAYEGDLPVFAALVATGVGNAPTVQGIFRTWNRLTTGKMSGPGYDIEDVTWTCYFHAGYALHTAYWHDRFGSVRSHGCVNMTPYDAWWVFQWSAPDGPNSPTVYVYWA